MVRFWALMVSVLLLATGLSGQQGSIRGLILDQDFDAPLAGAQVAHTESGRVVTSSDQGNYLITELSPGKHTLVISKEGYLRQVRADIVVAAGQLAEVDVYLSGDFTDMEEFIVQDALEIGGGTEASLLQLRFESPSLMDSVSADLMSRAGASDAASALRLVAGATVQNGKTAVIRGLPDRYVSSQLNGLRVPSADEDKRAVELDQFPSVVIESIQVSKTFTPDQQGDASGGAVDLRLKGIPDEPLFLKIKGQYSYNSQAGPANNFLGYEGGGVGFLGFDDGGRDAQPDRLGDNWVGAVGVAEKDSPMDMKWSLAAGGNHELDDGLKIGGFVSLFYERDSSFYDDGIDDSYWIENPGDSLTPQALQGSVQEGDFKTALFDVTRGSRTVQWGGLAALGLETENHAINLLYLYSRTAEDTATLAEDTRGKQYFFPGFDPNDATTPGHSEPDAAPYVRLETLEYSERTTGTFQVSGKHTLPFDELGPFLRPQFDWAVAFSFANLNQPDKRQFGSLWFPERSVGSFTIPAVHRAFKPGANFNLGNLQRTYKVIEEESQQFAFNLKLPFEQWSGEEGYFKFGYFHDGVDRTFDQDNYSNFNDNSSFNGDFGEFWSRVFPTEDHPITESDFDVDYKGEQTVSARYGMLDLPLVPTLKVVGGVRFESTEISIVNDPESGATWFPPGSVAPTALNAGDADVSFSQSDILPSIGVEFQPFDEVTIRAAYNETIARQTFKELTPILQQEFLGGPVFIGNPALEMSSVKNYDVRVDFRPYEGGLLSASWFRKEITDPIEYVQRIAAFNFTTAVNYPEGTLEGFELEMRHDLGHFWGALEGLSIGANATFIDAVVKLPADEIAAFSLPSIQMPITRRDMTNAPEHLFNVNATYELESTGTQIGLFYTLQGDSLLAGAGESSGNFVPSVYAKSFETLNLSVAQKIGENFKLQFQAKNLTNPDIKTVYRPDSGGDLTKTSFSRGIDYSLSLSAEFSF
ncbi:MAG: TonB-dependent receptor [Planctomycetes bacterium]|nr:TonB-dependent receptor [Planctomycetota bacterium]